MDGLSAAGPQALRDIHGITGVPWWPPGPDWWLVGAALLVLVWVVRRRGVPRSWRLALPLLRPGAARAWRREASRALRALRRRARAGADPKACLGDLSELLRRVAMARLGRPACAGHTGEAWLAWLSANDPQGFDWTERGRVLLTGPYAPPGQVPATDLLDLIDAVAAWVAPFAPRARPGTLAGASAIAGVHPKFGNQFAKNANERE